MSVFLNRSKTMTANPTYSKEPEKGERTNKLLKAMETASHQPQTLS